MKSAFKFSYPKTKYVAPEIRYIKDKLIVSGNVIERYEYEEPIVKGISTHSTGRYGSGFTTEEAKKENRKKIAQRARQTIRRLANANADELTKFFTITCKKNITDIAFARNMLKKYLMRLKYTYCPDLKYIVVIEFQKRGAIHFHMLCNLPYVKQRELQQLWGHGFVWINKIDEVDNVGSYITKYITKENMDDRLAGHKCYTCSKNLRKPIVIEATEHMEDCYSYINKREAKRRPFKCIIDSDYNGEIMYTQIVMGKDHIEQMREDYTYYAEVIKQRNKEKTKEPFIYEPTYEPYNCVYI